MFFYVFLILLLRKAKSVYSLSQFGMGVKEGAET